MSALRAAPISKTTLSGKPARTSSRPTRYRRGLAIREQPVEVLLRVVADAAHQARRGKKAPALVRTDVSCRRAGSPSELVDRELAGNLGRLGHGRIPQWNMKRCHLSS